MVPDGSVAPTSAHTRARRRSSPEGPGFIGSHLAELLLGRRLGGLRARRRLDGVAREHRAPAGEPELPPRHRVGPLAFGAQRARAQVRRRLPPRGCGRRPADRRAAGPHADDEHPGHRDGPRVLRPLRKARSRRLDVGGLRRPSRGEAPPRVGAPRLRADDGSPLGVRRLQGGRRVPRARLPRRATARLRDRPPLQHRRATPDGPVRHGHPAVRGQRARRRVRSRSTATGHRPAASATCRTRSGRSRASWTSARSPARSSTSARRTESRSSSSPSA